MAVHLDAVGGQEAGSRNWNGGQGKKVIEIVQTYFSQRRAITFRPALLAIGLQACPSDADKYEPNCFKIAPKTETNYDGVSNCKDKWFLQHSKSPLCCPSPDSERAWT